MVELLTEHTITAWLAFGAFCIVLEAMAIPGIGFLFAGLAAISVGGALNFGYLDLKDYILQASVFLGLSFAWAVVLWIPLKKFRSGGGKYSNIVGETATVHKASLKKGHVGKVRWSGAIMNAEIADDVAMDELNEYELVTVVAVKGTTLIVKPKG